MVRLLASTGTAVLLTGAVISIVVLGLMRSLADAAEPPNVVLVVTTI